MSSFSLLIAFQWLKITCFFKPQHLKKNAYDKILWPRSTATSLERDRDDSPKSLTADKFLPVKIRQPVYHLPHSKPLWLSYVEQKRWYIWTVFLHTIKVNKTTTELIDSKFLFFVFHISKSYWRLWVNNSRISLEIVYALEIKRWNMVQQHILVILFPRRHEWCVKQFV